MAKQSKRDKAKVSRAMREVFTNVPKTVKATGKTGEAKRKMQVAIGLSKARQAGADIPSMARGGIVSATGPYMVHAGEQIHPAPESHSGSLLGEPIKAPDAFTGVIPSA